jgi:hypothetical protein
MYTCHNSLTTPKKAKHNITKRVNSLDIIYYL